MIERVNNTAAVGIIHRSVRFPCEMVLDGRCFPTGWLSSMVLDGLILGGGVV
jgi:hypothetical protein